ncbi:MAG: L-rhamnose mutarotase [Ignavibacteriaceae bacterium]
MQNKIMFFVIFLSFLIPVMLMKAEDKLSGKTEVTRRVGSLIKVKPEYEERYIILHKNTFPGVLDRIRKSNIRNYSIFLLDGILFSHYEYVGQDYDADMKAVADPVTKDWWKLTDPMQEPLETRKEGEWWAEMELILLVPITLKPSSEAQRIGLTAEILQGKADELKKLCGQFSKDIEDATYNQKFQNAHMYIKDTRLYYYYEYTGDDIAKSFNELSKNPAFIQFQKEMNNLLVQKKNGYWEVMSEVFHTD